MQRPRLTLSDLSAAVVASAVGLAWVAWAAPGRFGPALIVVGPLAGLLWQRSQGGRGILGGMLGGAFYALLALDSFFSGSGGASRATMANWPVQLVLMTTVCLIFGIVMGLVAWTAAALLGPWSTPDPLGLTLAATPAPRRQRITAETSRSDLPLGSPDPGFASGRAT